MSDDNQKFLEKFKSQITTMGKNGILDSDNKVISITNINPNKIRKGSAFLKPIKKPNSKNIDTNKNNNSIKNDNIIDNTKNNIVNNNPYINIQTHQINNSPQAPLLYYQYQNPYMYFNYNYNQYNNNYAPPTNIYHQPYQLYYYPQQNQNMNQYYINNQINLPMNKNLEINNNNNNNNKGTEIKKIGNNKKRLRPISAQNIHTSNRSYLTNYSNITNLTINNKSNLTNINRFEYKPYTLKDYKEIINVDTLGGLGANIGTEEWEKKKEKMDKMSEYAKNIFNKTKTLKNKNNHLMNKKKEEISTRKRASEYSKLIRPKSSGPYNINVLVKKNNYNNKIKITCEETKKNNDLNNDIVNIKQENENEKIKSIFNDEINNEEDKEMMEYYNKFKIDDNEFKNNKLSKNNNDEDSLEEDDIVRDDPTPSIIKQDNNIKKKYKTFKEVRNAVNNRNNNDKKNNNIDNIITKEYIEDKEKEVDIESLIINREKYLKEIDDIKKGLQQK